LRLNHDSQLSPNRLELYKRQIDLFSKLCIQTRSVGRRALALGELKETPLTGRQRHVASLGTACDQLMSLLEDNVLLLPEEVGDRVADLWSKALSLVCAMDAEKPDPKVVIDHQVSIDRLTDDVIGACAEIIAPDHLSAGWREMIATQGKHVDRLRKQREHLAAREHQRPAGAG